MEDSIGTPSEDGGHTSSAPAAAHAPLPAVAGFWRRLAAFVVDGLILGAFGYLAGLALLDTLAHLGGWGRLVGFAVALIYFGLADSRIFNGQSPGKRLLKIRVCDASGTPLNLINAVARFVIFGVPYFLNGAPIDVNKSSSFLTILLTVVVFGLGLSIVYMLVFNRRTRQSLHDIALGSFVVPVASEGRPNVPDVWRGHYVVVALLIAASAIAPIPLQSLAQSPFFAELLAVQTALQSQPDVRHASVFRGINTLVTSQSGRQDTTWLTIRVIARSRPTDNEGLADRLAKIIFETYPDAGRVDLVQVEISYGYDIGIASHWETASVRRKPAEWRNRLERQSS